ncbi:MAG: dimethylarginine dimethylaminohydrolase family protein [bacterium]
MMYTRAIVRPPSANFADGLTTSAKGAPDFALALAQHERYCAALEACGLVLTRLAPDPRFPDATFVEDAALVAAGAALITRPGAPSRAGEVEGIRDALARAFATRGAGATRNANAAITAIEPPGTLDGGDVCEAGRRAFIGISERTNAEGALQAAAWFARRDIAAVTIDIRGIASLLHLKSGIAFLGDARLVVVDALADHATDLARGLGIASELGRDLELVRVPAGEEYAANCVRINDRVFIAEGFPRFDSMLRALGYATLALPMSEFEKMDGGLSCLSLRF